MSNTPREGFTVLDRLRAARDSHDYGLDTRQLLDDACAEIEGAYLLIGQATANTARAIDLANALKAELMTVLRCLDECRATNATNAAFLREGYRSKTGETL